MRRACPGGGPSRYAVPAALADVAPGEAVLVEFGRRRARGRRAGRGAAAGDGGQAAAGARALGRAAARRPGPPPGRPRRRALPGAAGPGRAGDAAARARSSASSSSPSADACRRLERLPGGGRPAAPEVLAGRRDGGGRGGRRGRRRCRRRPAGPRSCAGCASSRRMASLRLEWRVLPAGGTAAAGALGGHHRRPAGRRPRCSRPVRRPPGPPLGAAPARAAGELADAAQATAPRPRRASAERHGAAAVTSLARRGLLDLETQDAGAPAAGRPRRAVAGQPARRHASSIPEQVAALAVIGDGHARRRGTRSSCSTATRPAARPPSTPRPSPRRSGSGAARSCSCPRSPWPLPLVDRLRHDLDEDVAMLHSALGDGERADEWRRIRARRGARRRRHADGGPGAARTARASSSSTRSTTRPTSRTGRPRYQARDVALVLGRLAGAAVVLGSRDPGHRDASASPAQGQAARRAAAWPSLRRAGAGRGRGHARRSWRRATGACSRRRLAAALAGARPRRRRAGHPGHQPPRRGQRRALPRLRLRPDLPGVPAAARLPRLGRGAALPPLRRHAPRWRGAARPAARCASATSVAAPSASSRRCASASRTLRVGRLDRDVVERKGAAARVIDAFTDGALDVLVGTSLVTKGLDVPGGHARRASSPRTSPSTCPTSVPPSAPGSSSRQAVGRAGRGERPGRAIIQTYQPEHPAIRAVASGDGEAFVEAELERRRRFGSPPFGRLVKLTVALPDRARPLEAAHARWPTACASGPPSRSARVAVLGPVPAYVARRGGRWRFHVVLRGRDPVALLGGDPGRALVGGRRPREPAVGGDGSAALVTGAAYTAAHDRPTHPHPRRPAPAPRGPAGRQLRQVPARAARRPHAHDARCARRRPRGAADRRGRCRPASSRSRASSTSWSTRASCAPRATTATWRAACRFPATWPT